MTETFVPPFDSPFGVRSTADEVLDGIDLTGKIVIVTGASSGIGVETARALVEKGAHVFLAARSLEKVDPIVREIKESTGSDLVESLLLDLASFQSIRDCVEGFLARELPLDLLINNAGVMACPKWFTENGIEMQFGTNHVGHFLFTCSLFPALKLAADNGSRVRVVNLSSGGHRFGVPSFEDWNFETTEYTKFGAYGRSKTANIWFTIELNKRLQALGIGSSFAVHPGVIKTGLDQHMDIEDMRALGVVDENGELYQSFLDRYKTIPQGASTSVFAATSPLLDNLGGLYLEDNNTFGLNPSLGQGYSAHAFDHDSASQLWTLSEKLVGQSFNFGKNKFST